MHVQSAPTCWVGAASSLVSSPCFLLWGRSRWRPPRALLVRPGRRSSRRPGRHLSRHCGGTGVGWRIQRAWHLCTGQSPSGMAARAGPSCLTSSRRVKMRRSGVRNVHVNFSGLGVDATRARQGSAAQLPGPPHAPATAVPRAKGSRCFAADGTDYADRCFAHCDSSRASHSPSLSPLWRGHHPPSPSRLML